MMRPHARTRGPVRGQASFCFPAASPFLCGGEGKQAEAPKGQLNHFKLLENFGAGEEIRTLDPNLGKVVLYH